ncbi:uroporphyrinogen-III synthase [Bryocella elongata]|uniref:uroporphyrinogen-III synthase n=1 Tax=Bryocella elongata TaxID=863522 RepID=UPI0013576839|nr:uroporphyrinogen-III synthase [Bryocella elongata]
MTRAPEQAGELADALVAAGLEPVLVPTLTFQEVAFDDLDAALGRLDHFDWLVLVSVNAVKAFAARLEARTHVLPESIQIAVVGSATGKSVEQFLFGRRSDLFSPEPIADSLADALVARVSSSDRPSHRFLVVRAQEGREIIEQRLRAAGAEVTVASAYRTGAPEESLVALREMATSGDWPAAATFTSPSSARNLLGLLEQIGVELPESVRRIVIGPVTATALEELGTPAHAVANEPSSAALVAAVLRTLAD